MDTPPTISDSLRAELDSLAAENHGYFDFVLAHAKEPDVKNACKEIKRSVSWFYSLPKEKQEQLKRIATRLKVDINMQAWMIIEAAVPKAAKVMVDNLDDKNAWVRADAAKDTLNRAGIAKPVESNVNVRIPQLDTILDKVYGSKRDEPDELRDTGA